MNLSNEEWKSLSETIKVEFERLFADADTFLGKAGLRFVNTALKSVSVKAGASVNNLTALLVLADLAGRGDILLAGAEALRAVPFTGNVTVYEPIRQVICGAARRAQINGESGEPFISQITLPGLEQWSDTPGSKDELILGRLDGELLEPPSQNKTIDEVTQPSYHIFNTSITVHELWLMWAFGGSQEWPRERIDSELEAAAKILRRCSAIM